MSLVDSDARVRIETDLATNLFVEAGAGTGKTTALVARIVALVRTGSLPDGIGDLAAITFTENAAAELRNRVRQQLEAARDDERTLTGEERDRCRAALASLDDASLSTLHGFALRLLTDFPLEAGLPVGFTVQDEIRAGFERDRWWERSVDVALDDPHLSAVWTTCLALGLTPTSLRAIADRLHADWDLLESEPDPAPPVPGWDLTSVVQPLREAVQRYADIGPDGDKLTDYLRGPLRSLLADLDAEVDDLGRAAVLNSDPISPGNKGTAGAWARTGTPKSEPAGLLKQAEQAFTQQVSDARSACLQHLVVWLRNTVLADAERRQREGVLHFHDLLVLARRLLHEPPVRRELHRRWPVLMVDEFQDTDPLQVEIVHLLADTSTATSWQQASAPGGRLFFVGDPKQSIYRFRRADIELFTAVRDTVEAQPQLVQNFRSRPGVLRVVNQCLRELMDGQPDQVPYVDLAAARDDVPDDPGPDVLLLGGPQASDMAGVRELEAAHVAAVCREAVGSWTVRDGQRAQYRDIAILVPTRTSLSELEEALQGQDVPYRIESRSLVWDTDTVRELLAILEAIADPSDAVAVVTALRSAAFGCTDDDLVAWRRSGAGWDYRTVDADESPVARAMVALRTYHQRRWWTPVNQLVDALLREQRMVELTMGLRRPRDHWRRLRFVADQARAFLDGGGTSLGGFVQWARQQADRGADAVETVVDEPDDDAVRILTIHSSKGLEFPITVLSGINVDESLRVDALWDQGKLEVRVKQFETPGWAAARAREQPLAAAESVRLLYVAATRAQDHLVVSLHHKAPKQSAGRSHAARVYSQLTALTENGAVHQTEAAVGSASSAVPTARHAVDLGAREMAFAGRDALLARIDASVPVSASGLSGEDEEPADELAMVTDRAESSDEPVVFRPLVTGGVTLGSAVHRVLELIDFDADEDRLYDVASAVVAELEAPDLLPETVRRVRVALDSDLLRSATGRVWKEVPFSAPLGARFVEGYIDLVLERPDGLVVVDYKTDAARTPGEVDAKVLHYGPQLRGYARGLATATQRPVTLAVLLFIGPTGSREEDVSL